jgi:hypothetical protein
MIVTYDSICQHTADPKQLPLIGRHSQGVDERLRRIGQQSKTITQMHCILPSFTALARNTHHHLQQLAAQFCLAKRKLMI